MQSLGLIVVITLFNFTRTFFGNYDTLRKDYDQKNRVALHTKLDL